MVKGYFEFENNYEIMVKVSKTRNGGAELEIRGLFTIGSKIGNRVYGGEGIQCTTKLKHG